MGVCMFVCVFIQEHCVYMNSYLQLKIHNQTQFHVQMYMYTYVNMYIVYVRTNSEQTIQSHLFKRTYGRVFVFLPANCRQFYLQKRLFHTTDTTLNSFNA